MGRDLLRSVPEFGPKQPFETHAFHAVPNAGVYRFYDAEGEIIYVGQSGDIYHRLLSHRSKMGAKAREIIEFDVAPIADEQLRLAVECVEIVRWRPRLNRAILMRVANGRLVEMRLGGRRRAMFG